MIPNPYNVGNIVLRLRRAFESKYQRPLKQRKSYGQTVEHRLDYVVRTALAPLDWPPKARSKSGVYTDNEVSRVWDALDKTAFVTALVREMDTVGEAMARLMNQGINVTEVLFSPGSRGGGGEGWPSYLVSYQIRDLLYSRKPNRYSWDRKTYTAADLLALKDQTVNDLQRLVEGYRTFADPYLYDPETSTQEALDRIVQAHKAGATIYADWLKRYLENFHSVRFAHYESEKRQKYLGMEAPEAYDLLTERRTLTDLFNWQEAKKQADLGTSKAYGTERMRLYRKLPAMLAGMKGKAPTLGNLTRFAPDLRTEASIYKNKVAIVAMTKNRDFIGRGPEMTSKEDAVRGFLVFAEQMGREAEIYSNPTSDELMQIEDAVRRSIDGR